jgi:hypothetical protein
LACFIKISKSFTISIDFFTNLPLPSVSMPNRIVPGGFSSVFSGQSDDVLEQILNDSDSDFSYYESENDSSSSESESETELVRGRGTSRTRTATTESAASSVVDTAGWAQVDSHHGVPVWCPQYSKRSGPNFPPNAITSKHPIEYFLTIFTEEIFQLMATETNRYATQFFDSPVDFLPANSRFLAWSETSADEMKAYVGLQILMGLCSKPKLSDYWALHGTDGTPFFREVMSRNRYQLLNSFIHFNDNELRVPRGGVGYDPLFKIRTLVDLIRPLSSAIYIPERELSVDESMKKFTGRIYFRQYMPNKPTRWGIKLWSICESRTGYLLDWDVYTGKDNNPVAPGCGLAHNVVLKLVKDYENLGHIIYMDNFYSSPELFDALKSKNTGACGTVRLNRKNLPPAMKTLKLKKGDDPVFFCKNEMLACSWHDTARVNFLSTVDQTTSTEKTIRSKHSATGHRVIQKPDVASNYNQYMGGVDLFDQKCVSHQYPHKVQKWYHALFHFMKEMALVNSYILYQADTPVRPILDAANFRRQVAEKLVSALPRNTAAKRGRQSNTTPEDLEARLTERHFPIQFVDPKYKPNCVVCSETPRNPKRKQTRYGCAQCKNSRGGYLPMCNPECFTRFHTVKHYKR